MQDWKPMLFLLIMIFLIASMHIWAPIIDGWP